jgi:hypothetical protein
MEDHRRARDAGFDDSLMELVDVPLIERTLPGIFGSSPIGTSAGPVEIARRSGLAGLFSSLPGFDRRQWRGHTPSAPGPVREQGRDSPARRP